MSDPAVIRIARSLFLIARRETVLDKWYIYLDDGNRYPRRLCPVSGFSDAQMQDFILRYRVPAGR